MAFTAILEGTLLGVSEGMVPGRGDQGPSTMRTYLLASGTETLKLYTVDRDGDAGEFFDGVSTLDALPSNVRVQVEVRQDNNGKTKLRPLAIQAA